MKQGDADVRSDVATCIRWCRSLLLGVKKAIKKSRKFGKCVYMEQRWHAEIEHIFALL